MSLSTVIPSIPYRAKLKIVRKFARGFNTSDGYDARKISTWSSARKAAVTRYFNHIYLHTARSHYVYRPRSKKKLDAVKRSTGLPLPRAKVAFIQVPVQEDSRGKLIERPKVTVTKSGQVRIKFRGIRRDTILSDAQTHPTCLLYTSPSPRD